MMITKFGLSELIQSGILITLLTIAYNGGQYIERVDIQIKGHTESLAEVKADVKNHEKRISELEK